MITTYALTMRSLRNVLVNKKKYDRERRRKQTFRPLAQIINQYAEIAQTIRRTSTMNNQTRTSIGNNNTNNSVLNKTPYKIITTTSPIDSRTQFCPVNSSESNLIQDSNHIQYGSININNGTNINNELNHNNNQHLTISYIKSTGSKKKRHHQQQILTTNTPINRTKNDCDMSTLYEITEYSKSTSSSHDVTLITGQSITRKSIISNEQQQSSKIIDYTEQEQIQNRITTATINTISPLKEEENDNSTRDIDTASKNLYRILKIIFSEFLQSDFLKY
jgi:hypothetical protein